MKVYIIVDIAIQWKTVQHIFKSELLMYAIILMNLKHYAMLSERNQMQRTAYCMIPFIKTV